MSIRGSIASIVLSAALTIVGGLAAAGESPRVAVTSSPGASVGGLPGAPDEVLPAGSCRKGQIVVNACVTRGIASWRGVPFTPPVSCSSSGTTCRVLLNVYAPTDDDGPWPLVVVEPGGGEPPDQVLDYTDDFALGIADRGAVVMTANSRQNASFGADPVESLGDVACAVGVARATAPAYGADPARVVLVGHSSSAQPVALTGLTPSPMAPDAASCDLTSGSLRPDAIVAMAGLFGPDVLHLAANAVADEHIPVVIAQGGSDDPARVASSRSFQEVLDANGWHSTLVEVPTASHPGILIEPSVIDAVMSLTTAR